MLYKSADPCPAERTKRSRLNQFGFFGLCFICRVQSVYVIGAAPIGIPGCPEFAFSTASIESVRIEAIDKSVIECVIKQFILSSFVLYHVKIMGSCVVCTKKKNT